MANENNLGMRIIGSLNLDATKDQVNRDLQKLEGKINKLGLGVDGNQIKQNLDKNLSGVKETVTNAVEIDLNKVKQNNQQAFNSIHDLAKKYGGQIQSVIKNSGFDKNGKEDINSYLVTLKSAEDQIAKVRLTPKFDKNNNKVFSEETIQRIDNTGEAYERLAKQMAKHREQSNVKRQTESTKAIEKQNQAINKNIERMESWGQEIGRNQKLTGRLDQTSEGYLKTIIQQQDAYRNLKIREIDVNDTTGKWTATIKKNRNENYQLTGVIDKTTGAVHRQNQAVREATVSQKGLISQFQIAATRVNNGSPLY